MATKIPVHGIKVGDMVSIWENDAPRKALAIARTPQEHTDLGFTHGLPEGWTAIVTHFRSDGTPSDSIALSTARDHAWLH